MFCENCGKQNEDGAKFCENCGSPIITDEKGASSSASSLEDPGLQMIADKDDEPATQDADAEGKTAGASDAPSESAVFCECCGTKNQEKALFCEGCGRSLDATVPLNAAVAPGASRPHADSLSPAETTPMPIIASPAPAAPVPPMPPVTPEVGAATQGSSPKKPKKKTGLIVLVVVLVLAIVAALIAFVTFGLPGLNNAAENQEIEISAEQPKDVQDEGNQGVEEEPAVIEHTVVLETSGGTTYEQMTVPDGSIITTPAQPSRPGYVFEGWFSDKEFTTPFEFPHTIEAEDPEIICVYAKWSEEASSSDDSDDYRGIENEYETDEFGNPSYAIVYADCILPQSSDEYLTYYDVEWLDAEQTQRAINEIFARNGYIFQSSESEREFFESQDWYYGAETDMDVVSGMFNDYERENMKLLQEHRAQL